MLKFGRPLDAAIGKLISIVTVGTFRRWVRAAEEADGKPAKKPRPGGRPRIDAEIRALILKLARESSLGYTRIPGELRKLGIRGKVCRQTVKNVLREEGVDTGPARGETTWDQFLRRHARTLWAADFRSVRTWTMRGLVDCYVLVFMHDARPIQLESAGNS